MIFAQSFMRNTCIMKTYPCNIQRFFSAVKIENFVGKNTIFLIYMYTFKTLIVGTLRTALVSTHNLSFGPKITKIGIPMHTPVLLYKSGV